MMEVVNAEVNQNKEASRVHVFVRCKPRDVKKYDDEDAAFVHVLDSELIVQEDEQHQTVYKFDQVFNEDTDNQEVTSVICDPLISSVLTGYNASFMVYGQTGTGKTFTCLSESGVILTTIEKLINQVHSHDGYTIFFSYMQIYQDKIFDLLFNTTGGSLTLREHPEQGVIIEGLTNEKITTLQEAKNLLEIGKRHLIVTTNEDNYLSSRSHAICLLTVEKTEDTQAMTNCKEDTVAIETKFTSYVKTTKSKLFLCDLAGSERMKNCKHSGKRLEEARYINTSLLELGNVIHALVTRSTSHIPFRNSTLTRILKESLSGNCKAFLMICVSPYLSDLKETRCSLNFGQRALLMAKQHNPNIQSKTDSHWLRYPQSTRQKVKVDYKALSEFLSSKLKEIESAYKQEKENLRQLRKRISTKHRPHVKDENFTQSTPTQKRLSVLTEEGSNLSLTQIEIPEKQVALFSQTISNVSTNSADNSNEILSLKAGNSQAATVPCLNSTAEISEITDNSVDAQVDVITKPVDIIDKPVDVIDKHVDIIDKPVDVIDKHVDVINKPVDIIHKPVDIIHKPVDVIHKPADVIHKPADVIDKPVNFTTINQEPVIQIAVVEEQYSQNKTATKAPQICQEELVSDRNKQSKVNPGIPVSTAINEPVAATAIDKTVVLSTAIDKFEKPVVATTINEPFTMHDKMKTSDVEICNALQISTSEVTVNTTDLMSKKNNVEQTQTDECKNQISVETETTTKCVNSTQTVDNLKHSMSHETFEDFFDNDESDGYQKGRSVDCSVQTDNTSIVVIQTIGQNHESSTESIDQVDGADICRSVSSSPDFNEQQRTSSSTQTDEFLLENELYLQKPTRKSVHVQSTVPENINGNCDEFMQRNQFTEQIQQNECSERSQKCEYSEPTQQHKYSEPIQKDEFDEATQQHQYSEPSQKCEYSEPIQQHEYSEPSQQHRSHEQQQFDINEGTFDVSMHGYIECSFVDVDCHVETKEATIHPSPDDDILQNKAEEKQILDPTRLKNMSSVLRRPSSTASSERTSYSSIDSDTEYLMEADTRHVKHSLRKARNKYDKLLQLFEELTTDENNDHSPSTENSDVDETSCYELVLKFKRELEVELNKARQQLDDISVRSHEMNEKSFVADKCKQMKVSSEGYTSSHFDQNNNSPTSENKTSNCDVDFIASSGFNNKLMETKKSVQKTCKDHEVHLIPQTKMKQREERRQKLALAAIENCDFKKELMLTKLEKLRLEAVLSCVLMNENNDMTREFQQLSLQSMRKLMSSRSTLSSSASCAHLPSTSQSTFQEKGTSQDVEVKNQSLPSPSKRYNYSERFGAFNDIAQADQRLPEILTSKMLPKSRVKEQQGAEARSVQTDMVTQWLMTSSDSETDFTVSSLSDITSPTLLRRLSPCGQDYDDPGFCPSEEIDKLILRYKKKKFSLSCLPFLRKKSFKRKTKQRHRNYEEETYEKC